MSDLNCDPDIDKRLNYFDNQFLHEKDFRDEQAYHVDRQRRHNIEFHTPGIARGLAVEVDQTGRNITVTAGIALDGCGRQIILRSDKKGIPINASNSSMLVVISYSQRLVDKDSGLQETRILEEPLVEILPENPPPFLDRIRLARLTLVSGQINKDNSVRTRAGARSFQGGWVRLPFLPKKMGLPPPQTPPPEFTLLGYRAASDNRGAAGCMEVPIPLGARWVTRVRIAGTKSIPKIIPGQPDIAIIVTLQRVNVVPPSVTSTPLLRNIIAGNRTPTPFNVLLPVGVGDPQRPVDPWNDEPNLNAETQALALLVEATSESEIWFVAVEFA